MSETEWTSQLRRGVLELCVLSVLLETPSYGYEIVAKFEGLGALSTGENTLYPLLRRLKGEGYLETYAVESASGPTRQYYRVTNDGRARLKRLETEWKSMADAVARCIKKDSQP